MDLRKFTRQSIYHSLAPFNARRLMDRSLGLFLVALILLNVLATIIETVESIYVPYKSFFYAFEVFSAVIFSIEYIFRVWVSIEADKNKRQVTRLKYMFTPLALVDLIALLPFFVPMIIPADLRFIRLLRLLKIIKVFKLARYMKSFAIITDVIKSRLSDLIVVSAVGLVLLILSSSGIYLFEHKVQPEAFSSIPSAMWWAVVTLTAVGYGDIYPITVGGKMFAAVVAVLGVGLVALPTSILGAGLVNRLNKDKSSQNSCPHCSKKSTEENKMAS